MKIAGAFFTTIANIMIIMRSDNIEDVIKDFIAVEVIIEVDNIFADTMRGGQDLLENFIWVDKKRMAIPHSNLLDIYVRDLPEKQVLTKLSEEKNWKELPAAQGKQKLNIA